MGRTSSVISAIFTSILVNVFVFWILGIFFEIAISSWHDSSPKQGGTLIMQSKLLLCGTILLGSFSAWTSGKAISKSISNPILSLPLISGFVVAMLGFLLNSLQKPVPFPTWFLLLSFLANIIFCVLGTYGLHKQKPT